MSTNLFKALVAALPGRALQVADVLAVHSDGTATCELLGSAGQVRVRNPLDAIVGDRVFLLGGQINGPAPALPVVAMDV